MSFIPPIFQKLKILIPSSQACLVFDEKVIAFFFLQAMNFIISFYPSSFKLVYLSYHYFHVVTDWAIAEDLRLVDGLIL